ncbi:putative Ig domain-containing protein [Janthinobacterium rivuli]|uniref:Ig domain-containing protein n=1 Tax=Janthinobacterium rivuli TaxID=2751478 RepID=A0ABY8I380_9BURK|nr:putative Ig domain-containing protein [Janthinobacterium rivuli]WFR78412.1 putative Ig domain-containing protein [Janthinobacterium rivuli]
MLMYLAGTLLFVLLSLFSSQASAASTCPSPRAVSVVAGGEYYEDYTNAPCSQFGLTGTLVAPLYGTLEDSNATNAVRYKNTVLSATSDTFTVRDDVGQPIVYNVTITSAIVVAPATVPNATVAQAYPTTTFTSTGGAAPYTYVISAGALPAGMSLSAGGVLSGTPTAGGTFNFTVRATDSLAINGTRPYTLTVSAPTIAILPTTLPAMTSGVAYSQTIAASGGTGTYTYARTAGSLPAGLTLASNGTLSGTPTAAGAYSFTVTATDSSTGAGPYSGARAYSGTVAPGAPTAGAASATVAYGSSANPITLNLSGGAATSVAISSSALHGTATASGTSITYTPTAGYGGPDSFTYTASNGIGTSTPATVTITVASPTIVLAPSTVPAATVALAYSQTVTAANGTGPYTYAISAGSLPTGLSLNTATGTLSGTPTAGGVFNFTVRATDSSTGDGPYVGARAYSLTVASPTLGVAPSTLPVPTVGVAYSQAITASGGTAAYSYAVTAGSVPAGLSLAANGTLSGTPTNAGAYSFTVTATDSSGGAGPYTGARAYSGTVAPGAPTAGAVSATVAYGSSANPITLNLGGGAATSVAVASAASHGTATSNGTSITYTPTAGYGGPDSFTYTASNGVGTSAPATVTITVGGPTITITPSTVPAATVGTAYSENVTAANGAAPYTYAISAGALPAGLSLNTSTGLLSGTPTAAGTFNFTVRAEDSSTGSGPYAGARAYSLTVAAPTISIVPATLPAMTAGVAFSQAITATGGTPAYNYAVTAGSLPTGLTLAADGTLSGTPAAAGAYSVTITATDSSTGAGAPFSGSRAYSGSVAPGAPIAGNVSVTVAYGSSANPITLSLSGGAATSVAIATGAMHGTATASGTSITYTPTAGYGGPDSFTYTASNGIGTSTAATVTITVGTPTVTIVQTSVAGGTVGAAYSQTLTAANGLAPYTYAISAGALPAGVSLSSAGLLAGTPTAGGTFNFTVRATDSSTGSGPYAGARAYSLTVASPTISVAPATLPAMTAGVAFSQAITASGGTAAYSYAVTTGSLPVGLSLAANGTLSGTPTTAGAYSFSITATDSSTGSGPYTNAHAYSGTVAIAVPVAGAVTTTVAYGSSANPVTLNLGGGAASSVAVASGASHGTATASGTSITYTPTPGYSGSDSFSYTATNGSGTSAPGTVTVTVGAPTVSLAPASLPNPAAEAAYSTTLTAAGGTAPYTFSVTSGSLPAGLSLNTATGVLSGTTNVAGSFPFSIKVTDSSTGAGAPFSATNSYTLAVAAPVLTLTPASLAAIRAGDAYSQTFTAAGGVAPYAYSVSGGALPTGLVLNAATGIVIGTPTVAGSFAFTLQAKDAHQFTVQQALTLQVNQAPPPVPNETATTSSNQEVSLTIASTDGSPITAVTIVTPPQHGTVTVVSSGAAGGGSGRSFKVMYVPNANYFGPDAFSYTATGPGGTSAPATVSLTVAPQPVPVPVAKTATVLAGTPVTLNVTQGATGGPFTAVAITTQPASGTAVVNGMDIVYTPGINTSGEIRIGYTVSNAFGTSAPVTSTIAVNPMPQVLSQSATVVAGLTVTVDLTAGATGGPFTAANVLSVAPAEAGKAVVRDVGTAGKPSYQLSFAASGKFAGAAVVSYTLSNAYATSKPGVVNVTVTARRDPSVDPEVIGLQAAQADAARRFASAQLSNFTQRLESLHGDGWGRSNFGLSLTPPNDSGNPTAALARWQADEADRVFGTAVKPFMRKAALRQVDTGFSSERQQVDVSGATSGLPDMPQKPDTQKQALSLWLGGAVDFGQHYVNGRETGFRFRTNGVSVGGDYRLSDLATLGVGAGFSHDRSDVGQNGSRSTADSAVAAVYGSLRPSKGVFLDGVLGYGTLQYDASRYLSDGSGFATGERDGKQVFGALVGGIEMRQETWMWSPYGRVELMSAKLDPYTEKAAGINALSYFKQTVRSRIGALGVRAEGIYVGGLGTWFPRARLEYRHQFQGADDARLAYADLAADGPVYVIRTVPQQTGNWTAGLGVKLLLSNGMTITLDYNSNLNIDSGRTQSVMFGIAMPLK